MVVRCADVSQIAMTQYPCFTLQTEFFSGLMSQIVTSGIKEFSHAMLVRAWKIQVSVRFPGQIGVATVS